MPSLKTETLKKWTSEVLSNPTLSLAATVAVNADVQETLLRRESRIANTTDVFSHVVEPLGAPITNQKSSGRCWLFAATNVLRIELMKKYNIEKLQLSPSFLFFYDKLEKSNFFLENIVKTADEDVDSRIVQHLLTDPISDGGQFGMIQNILEKYGLVPNDIFPDTFNTTQSNRVNELVVTLLHQYAQELREAKKAGKDTAALKEEQMQRVHQLLTIFLGTPLGPNDEFDWEFTDKDKKFHRIKTTPLKFYKDVIGFDATQTVSLLNDPRNDYERVIHIDRLGNVVGAPEVHYLNVDIDVLANKAIEQIKENKAVFFGTHTPIYHHNPTGIIDTKLWDYKSIGFDPKQSKADRLRYHESLMTHAMAFVGVHLDEDGKPVRWKVENSWGEERGSKGYYTLTHDFFKEFVYQVVVDKKQIPEYADALKTEPITLPPWDPCGALAM
ncbi:Cysteine proteinase 1, mitochondrial [Wickerhamiella sorbophila]|uniref:Cysteine proteinase 1, mitochondrial n=1 Tax=Wickerhamiella sorbophila TaxID=45607 RepID=A0A2T0FBY2_9ASCO|nr:Cysteine proteinase 1, mitochondrial [Wickerhamiella sorbophila]PRT52449.1 Cysteine proteinase 1, mitochondrial [Wickerhamiella sorbophila]